MARVIAIAVAENPDNEKELEDLFFQSLRPSDLHKLIETVDIASNHTDFINSTLLVTAAQAHAARTETVEERLLLKPHTEDAE